MGIQPQEHAVVNPRVDALPAGSEDELLGPHGNLHLHALPVLGQHMPQGHAVSALEHQLRIALSGPQLGLQDVGPADKGGDEEVGRPLIQRLRGADLLDHPQVHDGDPVGNRHGLLLVMGHIDGGDPHVVLDLLDDRPHLHPQLGVQVGQGFVHQQHVRLNHQGPGQGDPLLLSAGQPVRHPVGVFVDMHQLHKPVRLLRDLRLGQLPLLQAEGHVVPHGKMGKDGVVLEHHADIPPGGIQIVDPLVVEIDAAALDAVEAGDHPQQRRLAAAGRTQQRKELALPDIDAQVRNHRVVPVLFDHMVRSDIHTHGRNLLSCFFTLSVFRRGGPVFLRKEEARPSFFPSKSG